MACLLESECAFTSPYVSNTVQEFVRGFIKAEWSCEGLCRSETTAAAATKQLKADLFKGWDTPSRSLVGVGTSVRLLDLSFSNALSSKSIGTVLL